MRRRLPNLIVAALLSSLPGPCLAGRLEASFGFYSFSARNQRNDTATSLSGVGSYHIGYRHPLWDRWEIDAGYSLIATKTFAGDLSFGFDLGANYFPLSLNSPVHIKTENMIGSFHQTWRPFVGFGFHQRNFQSTSSQYAGPGFKAGADYQYDSRTSFQTFLRYLSLGGPNESTATQLDLLIGTGYEF